MFLEDYPKDDICTAHTEESVLTICTECPVLKEDIRLSTSAAVLKNGSRRKRTSSTTFVSISSFIFSQSFVTQFG